jgi:hypothetical protein
MTYWLKTRLIPVDPDKLYSSVEEWEFFNYHDSEGLTNTVPGLTNIELVLEDNNHSVVRTMTYDSVDSRNAHATDYSLPSGRDPDYYTNVFLEESEPTPDRSSAWRRTNPNA